VWTFTTPTAGVTDQQAASFRMGTTSGDATIDDTGLGAVTLSGRTASAREGTFTSRVLDAQAMTDWDRATTQGELPKRTTVTLSFRTGSMSTPDDSWSKWTTVPKSGRIDGSSRYLQYRLTIEAKPAATAPSISAVGFTNNAGVIEHPKETDHNH
jgi:hypothetical protein